MTSRVMPWIPAVAGYEDVRGLGMDARPKEKTVQQECKEALELWLRWDEEHRRITELLFDGKHDPRSLEEQLDCCDVLRQRAIKLTQQVLGATPRTRQ